MLALIFSVALLVLSMAVSQFGPRILYRFVRDGITQLTIGLFLAAFVYTLLTFVVTRQQGNHEFVPQLTLCCSVVLVIASFIFLVVFSHRIAMSIQTQNVVAHIVTDVDAAIGEWRAEAGGHAEPGRSPSRAAELDALLSRCAAEGAAIRATRTGFIQEIDHTGLVAAAERAQAVVRLLYRPGQFVMEHAVLGYVIPSDRAAALAPLVGRHVLIGMHRTLKQDLEFGIAQLVEIALRALSPAINDTFTGLTCVDWLGDELRVFARAQELGPPAPSASCVRLCAPRGSSRPPSTRSARPRRGTPRSASASCRHSAGSPRRSTTRGSARRSRSSWKPSGRRRRSRRLSNPIAPTSKQLTARRARP